jgi:hypothetical protein
MLCSAEIQAERDRVFRPHAWYYAFTHGGVRRLIEKEKLQKLEEGLLDGTVVPRIAILDKSLAEVSPSLTGIVTAIIKNPGRASFGHAAKMAPRVPAMHLNDRNKSGKS